jgi:CheY-like chemotaxis protein
MPLTVLIADDDLGIRLSIGDYLEINGYSVITAENGKQALDLVEEYQPHLIVSDINMPFTCDFFNGTYQHSRADSGLSIGVR